TVDAVAEHGAIRLGPVVVLPGRDVAAAAVEVHLEDAGMLVLAFLPGEPAEVGSDAAIAVIAHRMASISVQFGERRAVVPETERPHHRVDEPFRGVADLRLLGRTVAGELHLAVNDDAAIASYLLDLRLTDADVRERFGLGQGGFHGFG